MSPVQTVLAARLGLVLVASLVFIILAVAGTHFFRGPESRNWRFRLHQGGSILCGLVHMAAAAFAPLAGAGWVVMAILLFLGGLTLFLWVQETVKANPPYLAFSSVHPDHMFVEGPYRFVRHPSYLAFAVVLLAVPVATWNPWLVASAAAMTASYLAAALDEEAAFARTPYADRYLAYAGRTGRFTPWLRLGRVERQATH